MGESSGRAMRHGSCGSLSTKGGIHNAISPRVASGRKPMIERTPVSRWANVMSQRRWVASDNDTRPLESVTLSMASPSAVSARTSTVASGVGRMVRRVVTTNVTVLVAVASTAPSEVASIIGATDTPQPVSARAVSVASSGLLLMDHHSPVFFMDAHGSAGSSGLPFCRSSTECPSGERTKAIRPSRGGRRITTP